MGANADVAAANNRSTQIVGQAGFVLCVFVPQFRLHTHIADVAECERKTRFWTRPSETSVDEYMNVFMYSHCPLLYVGPLSSAEWPY